MAKLTERAVLALAVPPGKREAWLSDSDVLGLRVRATAGTKTFYACWTDRATGERRRERLGVWGGITLEQARTASRAILGDIAKGEDPHAKRLARKAEADRDRAELTLTLGVLINDWVRLHLAERRERYRAEAERAIKYCFAEFLARPAAQLSRTDVVAALDRLAEGGKTAMAGRTMAYGRACYGWALKRGRVATNPFFGLPISAGVTSRDRVLSPDETGEIWLAADTLAWPFGPLVKVLLLTAQRREEVGGMRWSELSPDLDVWTIPASRAKNGMAHVVHLAPEARAILAELPRFAECDLVFTTTGKTPVSGFSKAAERIGKAVASARAEAAQPGQQAAQMPSWRFHDFRRSAVTWLASAGFPPHVCDKLLNHIATTGLSDVARVYQRAAFMPERKAALEAWARHVLDCAEKREPPAAIDLAAERARRRRGGEA